MGTMQVTDDTFQATVKDNDLVLIDFWAPWCGPCKQLTPILEEIVNDAKGLLTLAKINIDENQQIPSLVKIFLDIADLSNKSQVATLLMSGFSSGITFKVGELLFILNLPLFLDIFQSSAATYNLYIDPG